MSLFNLNACSHHVQTVHFYVIHVMTCSQLKMQSPLVIVLSMDFHQHKEEFLPQCFFVESYYLFYAAQLLSSLKLFHTLHVRPDTDTFGVFHTSWLLIWIVMWQEIGEIKKKRIKTAGKSAST